MQPIIEIEGVKRFKENRLVRILLERASSRGYDMNNLSVEDAPQEDWEQFYQLIGYSLSGYSELRRVSGASYELAECMAENPSFDPKDAEIITLKDTLKRVREGMIEGASVLFGIHQDDLRSRE